MSQAQATPAPADGVADSNMSDAALINEALALVVEEPAEVAETSAKTSAETPPEVPQQAEAPTEKPTQEPAAQAAPVEEKKSEQKPDPALEKSWAAIKRKEIELFNEKLQIKNVHDELTLFKEKAAKLEQARQQEELLARQDPAGYMRQRFGLAPQDVASALLDGPKAKAPEPAKAAPEVDDVKTGLAKAMEEIQRLRAEIAERDYDSELTSVTASPEYKFLNKVPGGAKAYLKDIATNLRAMGYDPTPADIASRAKAEYTEYIRDLFADDSVKEVVGWKQQPSIEASISGASGKPKSGDDSPKTLTNSLAAPSKSQISEEDFAKLSEAEQIKLAAELVVD